MNVNQTYFDKLFELLKKSNQQSELVSECLMMENSELSFSSFNGTESKMEREQILETYRRRSELEKHLRPNNHFVVGYNDLLPSLKKSELNFINVTSITTEVGTFLIFSDYEYSKFLGILKSKRTLSEVREKMKDSIYYKEITFNNEN